MQETYGQWIDDDSIVWFFINKHNRYKFSHWADKDMSHQYDGSFTRKERRQVKFILTLIY